MSRAWDVPALQHCSGLSVDTRWIREDLEWSQVACPADVRVGRRGPCPRGGDQGFAGSLETELMYLQMTMEILFSVCFVLFLKFLMDAGTATLLHFVPGDDSVARDTAVTVPTWGGDTESPGGHPGPSEGWEGRLGQGSTWSWDVGCGMWGVPRLEPRSWCRAGARL